MNNGAKFFKLSLKTKIHKIKLNQIIVDTFEWIEKNDYKERIINKALTGLLQALTLHAKDMNAVHISTLINRLGHFDLMYQTNSNELFNAIFIFALNTSVNLLSTKRMKQTFTGREVASILNGLPKLPISTSEQKKPINALLARATILSEAKALSLSDCAQIGGSIAKLGSDIASHQTLIENLLDIFDAQQQNFAQLDLPLLSELWQFCTYAKIRMGATKKLDKFIKYIETYLQQRPQEDLSPSHLQKTACSLLCSLLKKEYKQQIKQEYILGAYALDIALPGISLNIEIDGPFHYRGQQLRRVDKFRDFILGEYLNWQVLRIPHFEYEVLQSNEDKKDYLLLKLSSYPQLLNHKALTRLDILTAKQNSDCSQQGFSLLLSEHGLHKEAHNFSLAEDLSITTVNLANIKHNL
ncbi:MAG: hypothetical protein K0S11_1344 [Gammaproteobacteria bacterium]|jgi:very-short-patch-repair endonuclease|nr:hypothetical protein [Gammaproteobacteria bacterium]